MASFPGHRKNTLKANKLTVRRIFQVFLKPRNLSTGSLEARLTPEFFEGDGRGMQQANQHLHVPKMLLPSVEDGPTRQISVSLIVYRHISTSETRTGRRRISRSKNRCSISYKLTL